MTTRRLLILALFVFVATLGLVLGSMTNADPDHGLLLAAEPDIYAHPWCCIVQRPCHCVPEAPEPPCPDPWVEMTWPGTTSQVCVIYP